MLRRRSSKLRLHLDITLELVAHCYEGTTYCILWSEGKVPQRSRFRRPHTHGQRIKKSRGDGICRSRLTLQLHSRFPARRLSPTSALRSSPSFRSTRSSGATAPLWVSSPARFPSR